MDYLPPELSFIKEGQAWALVGDNGSGHSDLLYRVQGKGIEHVSFKHHFRNLANTTDFYYQQRFNSCDSEDAQTVHEYLLSQQSTSKGFFWNYGRVVRELRLGNLLGEQVIKLSNGETKRLMIAAALIRNPRALLLDHPLTGLDVAARKWFNALLTDVVDSGISVIIAADPTEVPNAVTHVAVVKNNAIIFADVRNNYAIDRFQFEQAPPTDKALLQKLVTQNDPASFQTIVRMTDVTVQYDGRKILSHITWHIKQGERWSLSGPNGAGKSTLLSLVNGDNPQAYANNIILFDRRRGSGESIWDIKKLIGFVSPEFYQYFPTDSSCLQVVESGFYDTVGLFRPSDPLGRTLCNDWLVMFHIEKYGEKLFSMVPASVQRLCLLARALIKNPALLILDEPTQGLDNVSQQFFTRLIDEICVLTNVTIIYVSHYEHHIPKSIERHLRLKNGEIESIS